MTLPSAPARPRPGAEQGRSIRARFRRTLFSSRWLHNWISVFIGVLLVLWVVSGLIMIMPISDTTRLPAGTGAPVDWQSVRVSPGQAVQAALGSDTAAVRSVSLQRMRNGMAYTIRLANAPAVLVDANTGQRVIIGDSLARVMVAETRPSGTVARVERLDRWEGGYRGPLPAWRVSYDDAAGTEAYVQVATGEVRWSERGDRRKGFWGHSVHVFMPLADGPGGHDTRLGALWVTSLISLVAMAFGYWLALPKRFRSRFA